MKICVVGAGGIGGLIAARLAQAGEEVSVIARGPHLAAIRADGLTLMEEDGRHATSRVLATDKISDVGRQDLVILGMEHPSQPDGEIFAIRKTIGGGTIRRCEAYARVNAASAATSGLHAPREDSLRSRGALLGQDYLLRRLATRIKLSGSVGLLGRVTRVRPAMRLSRDLGLAFGRHARADKRLLELG